jgi:NosR/NirI family transcriptional regulator, nitrous oxide reductase regulator
VKRLAWLFILTVALPVAAAESQRRFPPPDFTDHTLPVNVNPLPRAAGWDYADVAVLTAALAAASYIAVRGRSRKAMVAVMLLSLGYFGFVRGGCVCTIGSIQNVALALADGGYPVPWTVAAFFLLPLAFALIFGRAFCGGVCPMGAIQDALLLRPLRVPAWLCEMLGLLPPLYLGLAIVFAATGSGFVICQYDPFVALFRLGHWGLLASGKATFTLLHLSVPPAMQDPGEADLFTLAGLAGIGLLVLGMFVGRPYCRFLCPYGAILRPLSSLSRWHLSIAPKPCVKCRLCENACPFGAIRTPADPSGPPLAGKWALAAMLALTPILAGAGAWAFWRAGGFLAARTPSGQMLHLVESELPDAPPTVTGAGGYLDQRGVDVKTVRATAATVRGQMTMGMGLVGGVLGLVAGSRLVRLSTRRHSNEFNADRALCVSCGRCWRYCPLGKPARPGGSQ